MRNVQEIKELKEYLVNTYHSKRVKEQLIDQDYIEDNFGIDYLPTGIDKVKTGKAYRMVSAPAEHILSNNPVLYREPRGKAVLAADRVARECNRWLRLMLRQNPQPLKEHVKKMLGKGEAWIYTLHNLDYEKNNPNDMPVQFVIPDPTIVFVDPQGGEINGVPQAILLCFDRVAWDIKRNYPSWSWSPRESKDWSKAFPFMMYWDKESKYFEVTAGETKYPLLYDAKGELENGDGIQENIYKFVPFVHCYSGFGESAADGDPEKLAVSRIRKIRDLIAEYTAIRSVVNYLVFAYAVPPLDFYYDPAIWTPPAEFVDEYDRGIGAFNKVPATGGIKDPLRKGVDMLPDQQLFQHLYNIEAQINQEDPLALIGQAIGTSGRQQLDAEESGLRRYDTIVENSTHAWETAFGQGLQMCEKIPAIKPSEINQNDINNYYEVKIELKAEDPIAMQIKSVDGDRKQSQGIIDHETNLVEYQGRTVDEAQKIIAKRMVDDVVMNDPIIRRLMAIQVAREMGMEEEYTALEEQLGQMEKGLETRPQIGSEGGEPREGNIKTPKGREEIDMSLAQKPRRRRPI